jgi:DNA (cytosine-5)-methyltransferase 1
LGRARGYAEVVDMRHTSRGMEEVGLNGLALCAGYGGLEIAIERVFPKYRTVCYVEGEAFVAQHLIKKMEEGRLDHAPIWSNVRTFDGEPWRGKVDFISGGFPCQPYSSAGKQLGEGDPRDLWNDFLRIIGEVRPGFLFFENVPGIVKWRLDQIVLDLDKIGYDVAWGIMGASEVGAPHQRKRWFLFGVSNAGCIGWNENERNIWCGELDVERCGQIVSNPNKKDKWGGRFDSWWEVEPSMGRLVDGASDWVDKLRILGNGVVPQQAYSGLQILGARLACGIVANREPKGWVESTS